VLNAREHNLKDLSVDIPRNELTVVPFFKGIELQIAAEANPAVRKLIPELRSLFEEYGKGCGGEN
jgi:hypothetical protein